MRNISISVSKHTWLDLSVSWFVLINGVRSGGEINSVDEAIEIAKNLAEELDGILIGVRESNELF